jgi:hypothetical protein
MGNLCWAIPAPLEKGASLGLFADHPTALISPVHNPGRHGPDPVAAMPRIPWPPSAGSSGRHAQDWAVKAADFLVDELKNRIEAKTPAGFDMIAIMGRPGDEKTNATEQWVDEDKRPRVKLGMLSIAAIEKNETCDSSIFDPLNLAKGIEGPVNDRLFSERQPAYAISIGQRF